MTIQLAKTAYGTTSLGALIEGLLQCPPERSLQLDFCYLCPTTLASYRGYYEHLAIGWTSEFKDWPKVSEFTNMLQCATGTTFEGWKGGTYLMRLHTPIWVANRGEAGSTGIIGIEEDGGHVVLLTEYQL